MTRTLANSTVEMSTLSVIVREFAGASGVRDLEQAAEHLAAHALYRIETEQVPKIIYKAEDVRELLT